MEPQVKIENENVVIVVEGQETLIPINEIEAMDTIILSDGTVLSIEDFLQLLAQNDIDIEPAAGPVSGSGGVGEYVDDAGDILDGVDKLGGLDPRDFPNITVDPINASLQLEEEELTPLPPEEEVNLPPTINTGYAVVSDEGLENGNIEPDSYPSSYSGQLTISDPNGDLIILSLVEPEVDVYSGGNLVSWAVSSDGTTLIGVVGNTEVMRVTIDFDGNYTVTQFAQIDHIDPTTEDVVSFNVGVNASDGEFLIPSYITIDIQDDSPILNITDSTLAQIGADVSNAYVEWNNVLGEDLFVDGLPVHYEIKDGVIYGFTEAEEVFKLSGFNDGTYTFEQYELFDNQAELISFKVTGQAGGPESQYFITKDGSFLKVDNGDYAIKITADGDRDLVNPSAQGMGIDNNNIDPTETLILDFDNEGNSGTVDNFYGATVFLGKENQESDLVAWKAWFTDGTTTDGKSNDIFNVNAPEGTYIDKIEITGEVGKMTVPSVALFNESNDLDPSLNVEFTVYDGDGDSVSGKLDLEIQQATNQIIS